MAALGKKAKDIKLEKFRWRNVSEVSVKGVVFPFKKLTNADSILGPEMKSTGESMGRGRDYAEALLKACISSFVIPPLKGEVFMSLRGQDKQTLLPLAKDLISMGYTLSGTGGTAKFFNQQGLSCEETKKVAEGRPNCVDRIRSGKVALVVNTTRGRKSIDASFSIRRSCIDHSIPCITESDAALAFSIALKKHREGIRHVAPLPRLETIE